MDVTINETEVNVPTELATWGDLLDWIETDYLTAGQCITHVFMGGDEAYNYRDRLFCGRELNNVGDIAVRSGNFDKVVTESLAELDVELHKTAEVLEEVVRLLENRDEQQAYAQLTQLLDSIRIFFAIFSEELGWVDPSDAQISRTAVSAVLERAVSQLIAAQESRNWVSVCDVLEYEISPILESWQTLLKGTREQLN